MTKRSRKDASLAQVSSESPSSPDEDASDFVEEDGKVHDDGDDDSLGDSGSDEADGRSVVRSKPDRSATTSAALRELVSLSTSTLNGPCLTGSTRQKRKRQGKAATRLSPQQQQHGTSTDRPTSFLGNAQQLPSRAIPYGKTGSSSQQLSQPPKDTAMKSKQNSIRGLPKIPTKLFKPYLTDKTGGSLLTESAQRAPAGLGWQQIEATYSGPTVASQMTTIDDPIAPFSSATSFPTRTNISSGPDPNRPRVGTWQVPTPEPSEGPQTRAEELDLDGIESGQEDEIRQQLDSQDMQGIRSAEDAQSSFSSRGMILADETHMRSSGENQRSEERKLLPPTSKNTRAFLADQVERSPYIPTFIKPAVISFLVEDKWNLPEGSYLRTKKLWLFDMGHRVSGEGGDLKTIMTLETSPPVYSVQYISEQIWNVLRESKPTSAWHDKHGRYLESQTGEPRDDSISGEMVPIEQHAALLERYDQLTQGDVDRRTLAHSLEFATKARKDADAAQTSTRALQVRVTKLERLLAVEKERNQALYDLGRALEARVEGSKARHDRALQAQQKFHDAYAFQLRDETVRLKAKTAFLLAQNARTDNTIRRKAAELDKIREQESDRRLDEQRKAVAIEKARAEEKARLLALIENPSADADDKRRAMIMLASLGEAISTTNGSIAAKASAPSGTSGNAVDDELAELAAEAAAADALDPSEGAGVTGRRSRRRDGRRTTLSAVPISAAPSAAELPAAPSAQADDELSALLQEAEDARAMEQLIHSNPDSNMDTDISDLNGRLS